MTPCALVLDGDAAVRSHLRRLLSERFDVFESESGDDAMEKFARVHPSRVFLGRGVSLAAERLSLLREVRHLSPNSAVVVLLRPEDGEAMVRAALREGAFAAVSTDEAALARVVRELDAAERAPAAR